MTESRARKPILGTESIMDVPHTRPETAASPPSIDRGSGTLTLDGQSIGLTRTEQAVLDRLMRSEGRVVSRSCLFDTLYASKPECEIPDDRIIDVFICKLRAKATRIGAGAMIETAWGRGWRVATAAPRVALALSVSEWASLQVIVDLAARQNAAAAERVRAAMQRAA